MSGNQFKIIMLGPQGSGKGTQAEMLAEHLNIPNISVGQLLRDEVAAGGELAAEINQQMNSGGLVSNAIVNKLVAKKIDSDESKNGFIFDGFPRIRIQAKFLNTLTDISHVLLIDISDEEAVQRISGRRSCLACGKVYHIKHNPPTKENVCDECGAQLKIRPDDTEAAIKERLKIYHTETEEVVEYYASQNKLIKINGQQSIENVRKEIFDKLELID